MKTIKPSKLDELVFYLWNSIEILILIGIYGFISNYIALYINEYVGGVFMGFVSTLIGISYFYSGKLRNGNKTIKV